MKLEILKRKKFKKMGIFYVFVTFYTQFSCYCPFALLCRVMHFTTNQQTDIHKYTWKCKEPAANRPPRCMSIQALNNEKPLPFHDYSYLNKQKLNMRQASWEKKYNLLNAKVSLQENSAEKVAWFFLFVFIFFLRCSSLIFFDCTVYYYTRCFLVLLLLLLVLFLFLEHVLLVVRL